MKLLSVKMTVQDMVFVNQVEFVSAMMVGLKRIVLKSLVKIIVIIMGSVLIEDAFVNHNMKVVNVKIELLMKNKLLVIHYVLEFVLKNVLMDNLGVISHVKKNVVILVIKMLSDHIDI